MLSHYLRFKQAADFTVAAVALVLLSPVILFVSGFIFLKIGLPIFFLQTRPGLRGKPFILIKFRTMANSDSEGRLLSDEERLSPFGSWLRATSIDELPSLINILRGELSFIGPRPLLMQYLPHYSHEQARRHDVKPGFSGWAQINGRNSISWEEKFRLDLWYVDHQSFWLDLRIFMITIWKVIRRKGISAAGEATMAPFTGSAATSEVR